jgi:hypothetical protein
MTAPFLLDEMSEKSACLLGRSTYVAPYARNLGVEGRARRQVPSGPFLQALRY